ncbi:MAG: glutathione binding-like protein, partial [Pseudomonadota bacterium]
AFKAINPNSKIPALIDPDGPDGAPLPIIESGAILLHLADKSGKLMPSDGRGRSEAIQWLMFQMGGVGPMFGQFGHFYKFARDTVKDPYPLERYSKETQRLLGVLNARLVGRDFLVGDDATVADIATVPWVRVLSGFYGGAEDLGLADFKAVNAWVDRCMARPGFQRGSEICTRPS